MMIPTLVKDLDGDECNVPLKLLGAPLTERLKQFNDSSVDSFAFSCSDTERRKLHDLLFKAIDLTEKECPHNESEKLLESLQTVKEIVRTLRIISRDSRSVLLLDVDKYMPKLIILSGLSSECEGFLNSEKAEVHSLKHASLQMGDKLPLIHLIQTESLKCMCNWVFHGSSVRRLFIRERCSQKIVSKLRLSKKLTNTNHHDLTIFHVRLLFLLSALEKTERQLIRVDYHGFKVLVDLLEVCTLGESLAIDSILELNRSDTGKQLTEEENKIVSEILKALFNISMSLTESAIIEETDIYICRRIVAILRYLLTKCSPLPKKPENLLTHIINMFVNIPKDSIDVLTPKVEKRGWYESVPRRSGHPLEFELHDVDVLVVLLEELEHRMLGKQTGEGNNPLPILSALAYIARLSRIVRRYYRQEILPPLRDVTERPEHLDTLRGQLVRLMRSLDHNTKELAADFLFVLCKENVDRFVKYTGYGNAAGLLASHGLMGGKKHISSEQYSSDDEDSDTEEYEQAIDQIDPVLGAVRPPAADPVQEMTEDQKLKSSEELAGLIGRLSELNVIKPMKVGDDGRPQELTEEEAKKLLAKKIRKSEQER